ILGAKEGWVFWRDAPIAIGVLGNDAVGHEGAHVIDPTLHGRVMALDDLAVAVLVPQHTGQYDSSAGPGHVVRVKRPVRRTNIRQSLVLFLGVSNILKPFGIKRCCIEQKSLTAGNGTATPKPALPFIALGTIRRYAAVVAANGPTRSLVNPVQQRIGAYKIS